VSKAPDEPRLDAPSPRREERRRRLNIDGEHWVVREIDAPTFDRRGGRHLIFECSTLFRRVRVFPPNWYELEEEALFALSPGDRPD
jgi:hypothetical protein